MPPQGHRRYNPGFGHCITKGAWETTPAPRPPVPLPPGALTRRVALGREAAGGGVAVHGGAQVHVGEGELREGRGRAAREARHGEEEVCGPGQGSGTAGLAPTPAPPPATPPTAGSGPHPPVLSRLTRGVGEGVRAKGLSPRPCLQLLVQVLLDQPKVFSTERAALVQLVDQGLGVYTEGGGDTSCVSPAGLALCRPPLPGLARGLTCQAHGTEQFLELLELPRGQEQVQEAHLPRHLQLRAEGAGWSSDPPAKP